MRKLILLFTIISFVASHQIYVSPCEENEIRDWCLNRDGPCYNDLGSIITGSPTPKCCAPGCKCKDGYEKSKESGKCVPRRVVCKFLEE